MHGTQRIGSDREWLHAGTSAETLKLLANREMDALTAKKYMAAYHRKAGRSFEEISQMILASYHAVRAWLLAMHKGA